MPGSNVIALQSMNIYLFKSSQIDLDLLELMFSLMSDELFLTMKQSSSRPENKKVPEIGNSDSMRSFFQKHYINRYLLTRS